MKEVQRFYCEICDTIYARKDDAINCEKSHKIIKKITKVRYLPKALNEKGYPTAIAVMMDDGELLTYKR